MLIAQEKKKTNIVEYLLYMYQIEDIIRSLNLEIALIEKHIVNQFDQPEKVKLEIKAWYEKLIQELRDEEKEGSGHLNRLIKEVNELQAFHSKLLTIYQDEEYKSLYQKAKPILVELVKKSAGANLINEIDVALNGIYGLLVLKLKGSSISESTSEAMLNISRLLAHLSFQFHKSRRGELDLKESLN